MSEINNLLLFFLLDKLNSRPSESMFWFIDSNNNFYLHCMIRNLTSTLNVLLLFYGILLMY